MNNIFSVKFFKILIISLTLFTVSIILTYCSSPTESKYDPPSDHIISKDGAKHKSGLNSPLENCVSCHGKSHVVVVADHYGRRRVVLISGLA